MVVERENMSRISISNFHLRHKWHSSSNQNLFKFAEGLKSFPRCTTASNVQVQKMQELDHVGGHQGLPTNQNKLMAMHPALNSQMSNKDYQNLLMRQNSMNSTQQEGSSPFNTSSQATLTGVLQNAPVNGFSGYQVPQRQQQQSQSPYENGQIQQSQSLPSQNNQTLHQQMVQQYLQEMSRKNNGSGVVLQQQAPPKQNPGGNTSSSGPGFRNSGNGPTEVARFKAAASSSMSEITTGVGLGQKESDLTHGLHSSNETVADIAHELIENGFFSSDLDDFDFNWK